MTQLAVLDQITAVPSACQIGCHNFATNSMITNFASLLIAIATKVNLLCCAV